MGIAVPVIPRKEATKEICRAIDFLGRCLRQGNSVEDAFLKVRQSYNQKILDCVVWELKKRKKLLK